MSAHNEITLLRHGARKENSNEEDTFCYANTSRWRCRA